MAKTICKFTGNGRIREHAYGTAELKNMAEAGGEGPHEGPVSFADFGIPQTPKLRDTPFGKVRHFKDVDTGERIYVVVSVLSLLATFSFTVYKLCTLNTEDADFTFALVLLVSSLFCLFYTIQGVLQERATAIFILGVATTVVLVYLIVNYAAGSQDTVKLVRLIFAAILCPPLIVAAAYLSLRYYQSGNLIFRTVGANTEIQNMCRLIFFFFDLLKFDLQLSVSMVIFIMTATYRDRGMVETEDILVLSIGGVVTIAWFLLGYISMRIESKYGVMLFFILSPLDVGYVIYNLAQLKNSYPWTSKTGLAGVVGSTIACGSMSLIVRVTVLIAAVFVFRNFNKGLKQKAFGLESQDQHLQERGDQ